MVESKTKNPSWTRDELILALDYYFQNNGKVSKASESLKELSDNLNKLRSDLSYKSDTFRNPNGVEMTLGYFKHLDINYSGLGFKPSLLSREIWDEFNNKKDLLNKIAKTIKIEINKNNRNFEKYKKNENYLEYIEEADEGRILTRIHIQKERSRLLIKAKKQDVLKKKNILSCEACSFNFENVYGERGQGFIEVHHIKPLHTLEPNSKTKLDDLALLCANCHRMIHSKRPWLTVEELKSIIK